MIRRESTREQSAENLSRSNRKRPPLGGEVENSKCLLCDPESELRQGGSCRSRAKTIDWMGKIGEKADAVFGTYWRKGRGRFCICWQKGLFAGCVQTPIAYLTSFVCSFFRSLFACVSTAVSSVARPAHMFPTYTNLGAYRSGRACANS